MSLYNMVHGVTGAAFFILPMLGKHPDEYPRFRDCFTNDDEHPEYKEHILVYTRTGGANRESYEAENNELTEHPNYVGDYDDSFDSTFAVWAFTVPEEWKADYDKILNGNLVQISDEYKKKLYEIYSKLKDKFDGLFLEE